MIISPLHTFICVQFFSHFPCMKHFFLFLWWSWFSSFDIRSAFNASNTLWMKYLWFGYFCCCCLLSFCYCCFSHSLILFYILIRYQYGRVRSFRKLTTTKSYEWKYNYWMTWITSFNQYNVNEYIKFGFSYFWLKRFRKADL